MTTFKEFYDIHDPQWIDKKGNLDYISWAVVEREIGFRAETFDHGVVMYEDDGKPAPYLRTPLGIFVHVWIEIDGVRKEEIYPVYAGSGGRPRAVSLKEAADAHNLYKNEKRAFVKCAAKFGFGLRLWSGEDLVEEKSAGPASWEPKKTGDCESALRACKSLDELKTVWLKHQSEIKKDPAHYQVIKEEIKARLAEEALAATAGPPC